MENDQVPPQKGPQYNAHSDRGSEAGYQYGKESAPARGGDNWDQENPGGNA